MMKISKWMALLIVFLMAFPAHAQYESQIRNLAEELARKIKETNKKRIAVADFTETDGKATKLGKFLGDELNSYLPEAGGGFEVIDRSRLSWLMKENKLTQTGLINDPSQAARLGKLAGIEVLVYGSITPFSESVRVNVKVLDIERAIILRSFVGNITRTADINILLAAPSDPDPVPEEPGDVNAQLPKPAKDCKYKPSCVVCMTNKSSVAIEAIPQLSNQLYGYAGNKLLIHPGKLKCWTEMGFSISGDHDTVRIHVSVMDNELKTYKQVIEPCQVYNVVHQ